MGGGGGHKKKCIHNSILRMVSKNRNLIGNKRIISFLHFIVQKTV